MREEGLSTTDRIDGQRVLGHPALRVRHIGRNLIALLFQRWVRAILAYERVEVDFQLAAVQVNLTLGKNQDLASSLVLSHRWSPTDVQQAVGPISLPECMHEIDAVSR